MAEERLALRTVVDGKLKLFSLGEAKLEFTRFFGDEKRKAMNQIGMSDWCIAC